MEGTTITVGNIVRFRGDLFLVKRYSAPTERVTLVPVRVQDGCEYREDGPPQSFNRATVERETTPVESFEYQDTR